MSKTKEERLEIICPNCHYNFEKYKGHLEILIVKCYFCESTICIHCKESHYKEEHDIVQKLKEKIGELSFEQFITVDNIEEKLNEEVNFDYDSGNLEDALDELESEGALSRLDAVAFME